MSWAINGLIRGDFLNLPLVREATYVGIGSSMMAIGLRILGFSHRDNVIAATFVVVGVGGLIVSCIGMIAYSILAIGFQVGNQRAGEDL